MKTKFTTILISAALGLGLGASAWATNTVTVTGDGPHQFLDFISPYTGTKYTGELLVTIVTPTNTYVNCPTWCVDFYTELKSPFTASNAAPTGATYMAVSYLAHQFELAYAPTDLTDTAAVAGAATQLAMWELLDPTHTYTVTNDLSNPSDLSAVVSLASALVTEAAGKRPLLGIGPVVFNVQTTQGASSNLVNVLVTLTESSQAVIGEDIILQTSEGTFSSPTNGTTITTVSDTNGQVQAVVDLGTNRAPLTVFAFAFATPLGIFLPDQTGVQPLLGTLGQVPYTASSDFTPSIITTDPSCTNSIASNFNGTPIAGGNYIWFNSVLNVKNRGGQATSVMFDSSTITFTANSVPYTLLVPPATVIFDPTATLATTIFDTGSGSWVTTVPVNYNGNVFLSGLAYLVPGGGLPGGINPVVWSGEFTTPTPGLTMQWKWAAAVYTTFSSDMTLLGVKPIDGSGGSLYSNSDHAGTPENFKPYVTGGARGGGGSNWTGSYSGTDSCKPVLP